MKFALNCKLLAIEERTSKTGNKYFIGLFCQGVSTMQFILGDDIVDKLKVMTDYDFIIEYNTSYKNFKLLGFNA